MRDTAVDLLTNSCVDLELLGEIDKLCRHVISDMNSINERKGRGPTMFDVFELLWDYDEPKHVNILNNDIEKGSSNVKEMLNKLTYQDENPDSKKWSHSPPVDETSDEFELNQYGELLGHLYFESEQPRAELYALAFNEEIRSAFDVQEPLLVLVDEFVDSDVPA